jgi:5-(carboxyamino)imidazole ribonucleotide synthase
VHWHDYGKAPRPGRKIGHATLTAPGAEELEQRARTVASLAGGRLPALLDALLGS